MTEAGIVEPLLRLIETDTPVSKSKMAHGTGLLNCHLTDFLIKYSSYIKICSNGNEIQEAEVNCKPVEKEKKNYNRQQMLESQYEYFLHLHKRVALQID